jgi:hypothetical protein
VKATACTHALPVTDPDCLVDVELTGLTVIATASREESRW